MKIWEEITRDVNAATFAYLTREGRRARHGRRTRPHARVHHNHGPVANTRVRLAKMDKEVR